MPEPEAAADAYLADMLERCAASGGRVFLGQLAEEVVGFVCVMAREEPHKDEAPEPFAYISDLVVRTACRGRGVGRQLIQQAENFARDAGAGQLRVGVLARNADAHRLYRDCGFRDYTVQLVKPLRA